MRLHLPLVAPAPLVSTHAAAFRDLCENRCPFAHVEQYRTGLMVRENKSRATGGRCVIKSVDKRRACALRADSSSTVYASAAQVGDGSPRHAATMFRATVGLSPAAYRARRRQESPAVSVADAS
jgi:AraC-like DNA-binding protein